MSSEQEFFVRFWGVRGSIACPSSSTRKYGGNTSTLEVRCGNNLLIFDAGTGLRYLSKELLPESDLKAKLFLSHTHYDHICGFPFFSPAFVASNNIEVWAGHLLPKYKIKDVLAKVMREPIWPVGLDIFQSISYHDFVAGETLHPYPDVQLRTCPLAHTNGATGYRVDYRGRSLCYLTDTEHTPGTLDRNILDLIEGADLVIYDSMLTDEEYDLRVGWGHSTWEEGVRLCDAANVDQFCVFHHDPDHNDDFMDKIATDVDKVRPGSVVAREGMVLSPGRREPISMEN